MNKVKADFFSWSDLLKALWYFLDEDKLKFLPSFFVLLGIYFYDLVPTYIVGKIIDFFISYQAGQSLSIFYFYVIFISITYILSSLIRLKSKKVLAIIGYNARARARAWGFERLTEFSLEWHNKENTGNKLQRIFTGADGINNLLKIFRKDLLKIFASIIGVTAVFLFTDFKFVIFIFIYIILFLYIEFTISKKVFALSNEFNKFNQSAGGTYIENANNILSIKALGGEGEVTERVWGKETLSRDIAIKKTNTNNLKWRFLQLLNGIALGVFLIFTGSAVINHVMTVGTVLVFYTYFYNKLQAALGDISELHTDMIDIRSDISQMMPIFKETEFIKTGNEKFPKNWGKIELKGAVMNYGSGQEGLKGFDLSLKRNEKIGLAGLSGSGKSTLAKIILGLYALEDGEFKVGDKNYYSISHNEILKHITVVLQETELFNLSLRDNIMMMGEENIKLLNLAVEISQLDEVARHLPEGLDSIIGEKGYMLSGGERQRLGIARAIYKNAPIIILDEATSSLDSETENKIMEKLLGEYGEEKTFLIIAHRLGTLKYTDNIAVMDKGKIVEVGGYEKLINDYDSVFYRLNKEKKSAKAENF
jgi:ABC-type multidrug transport system fused ATPase/permease subunit